jgi:bisphosphoglycerate-dependent phosphoglycerate mutase
MANKLIFIRHQQTDWNEQGLWQGKHDRHLTLKGFHMAERLGESLKDIKIDYAFTSEQVRTIETLSSILETLNRQDIKVKHAIELNERDYGDYTGKNKWQVKSEVGEEEFQQIRRDFDYPIPNGESLQDVYSRVVPYYMSNILPLLQQKYNILVVAHGNSLRALLKYINGWDNATVSKNEFDFETIAVYEIDTDGKAISTEKWTLGSETQILATIGPSSGDRDTILHMIQSGMDAARLNFSWGTIEEHSSYIDNIRELAKFAHKKVPIIGDLPGPRIQNGLGHTYDKNTVSAITEKDIVFIKFGIKKQIDYFAISFADKKEDIENAKKIITDNRGTQKIIAKIEKKVAIENIDEIISASNAIMIARGDLGNEVPLGEMPFIEQIIINKCNSLKKPVITATQMMLSMVNSKDPTRAEVTDVSYAVTSGSDVIMLSEETATGKYPIEAIKDMEKIVVEAEKHRVKPRFYNQLKTLL